MTVQSRYITCPKCGMEIQVKNISGRKPLNISVKNICDALRECRDITMAAKKMGCSRAYIYHELGHHGTTPREVMEKK